MDVVTEHTCLHLIQIDAKPISFGLSGKTVQRQLYVCPFYPYAGKRLDERFEVRLLSLYDGRFKLESVLYGTHTLADAIESSVITAQSLHGEPA